MYVLRQRFYVEKKQKKIFFTKPIYLQILSHNCDGTYPEIDDPYLKGTLWTYKQWLTLKMRVHHEIAILLVLMSSHEVLKFGYVLD